MKYSSPTLFVFLFFISILPGCDADYVPKPKGYFRIDFPEKNYRKFNSTCNYSFDYPVYTEIQKDNYPGADSCWVNLEFHSFNGTLHISYKKIENNLRQLTEDSRTLVMKHASRAEEIGETPFITPKNIYGMMYDIKGNVASSVQFYLTDSTKHFMRASFYFNLQPNQDSLAPVLSFIQKDLERFLDSFEWEK